MIYNYLNKDDSKKLMRRNIFESNNLTKQEFNEKTSFNIDNKDNFIVEEKFKVLFENNNVYNMNNLQISKQFCKNNIFSINHLINLDQKEFTSKDFEYSIKKF